MPPKTTRFVTGPTARMARRAGFPRGCAVSLEERGRVEELENRALLSFAWTASEVYLSELVNRARANPQAEGLRLGIDLSAGLTGAEAARLVPQEPLALNQYLTIAARAHSLDMATRGFFDHVNPDGQDPTARAQAAGYGGTAGENIAGGYSTIDAVHLAWLQSVGHRKNILSLHSNFDSSFHYDEFGPGFALDAGGAYGNYYTEMFGYQGPNPVRYILGVVYNDADSDDFYSIGEGAGGVRIDVALQSAPGTVVGTYTTDGAGNYQIALGNGAYNVTFTRISDGYSVTKTATVAGVNVKVDAVTAELGSPTGGDDYANIGQWSDAGVIALDPSLGNGAKTGVLENVGDTDLFRFVATRTGLTAVTLTHPTGQFAMQLVAYNGSHGQVAAGTPGGEFGNGSTASFQVAAGQTYYVLARASLSTSLGSYLLLIQGPTDGTPSDDFADIGELGQASTISLESTTGSGTKVGYLETVGDSDLFKIVVPRTGTMTVTAGHPQGAFGSQLRVFDSSGVQVHLGVADPNLYTSSTVTFDVVEGETYYLSVEAANGTSLGLYTVQIIGPGPAEPERPVVINQGVMPQYWQPITSLFLGGKLTLVFTNGWGQPLFATANGDGSWDWYDIRGGPDEPVIDGATAVWQDSRDHRTYVAIRGMEGLLLFREETPGGGVWTHRNLTDEIADSLYISNDIELVFDPMRRAVLAGASDSGELVIYSQLLRKVNGQYKWTFRNITEKDVENRGLEMPYVASELVSWVTPNKTCNLAFLDFDGNIQIFYKVKGRLRWQMQNLSAVTGTAPLVGEITVFQTPRNGGVHISGTDENGHLWATSYTTRGNGWWGRDLTARLHGYAFQPQMITTYQSRAGLNYVVGVKDDGRISAYRYSARRNSWRKVNMNLAPPAYQNIDGRLTAAVDMVSGEIDLVSTLNTYHLVRWYWRPGHGWAFEDVTQKLAEAEARR